MLSPVRVGLAQLAVLCKRGPNKLRAFVAHQSGATMIVVALSLPALVGAMGLSAEVSYWYLHRRALQNAADAAAIAAATNASTNYAAEAKPSLLSTDFRTALAT